MNALVLVDVQNDFVPGGTLAVAGGDQIVDVCNRLSASGRFDRIVATQDWHPPQHGSFAANNPGSNVGELGELGGLAQVMWPVHCVQGSQGAEFLSGLDRSRIDRIFQKGTDLNIDSYSGFFDNGRRQATGLGEWLRAEGVTHVTICGLATDYCVKFTALDARELGFETTLVLDGCRGVNLSPGDSDAAVKAMREAGVRVLHSTELLEDPSSATETVFEGRYLRLVRRGRWEFAQRCNSTGIVVIIPITDAGELVLVEQYRAPMDNRVFELPAGLAGDIPGEADEALERAARRELVEETGFEATDMTELIELPPTAGMCSEVYTFFRATGLRRVGAGGGDSSEDIQVHVVPLAEVPAWLSERQAEGAMVALSVYAGLWFASR